VRKSQPGNFSAVVWLSRPRRGQLRYPGFLNLLDLFGALIELDVRPLISIKDGNVREDGLRRSHYICDENAFYPSMPRLTRIEDIFFYRAGWVDIRKELPFRIY
jgi:hypothetical protein